MDKIIYKEIFDYPVVEFSNHLEGKNNDRILFSGRYGIGKTSFLNDFFSKDEIKSKYDVFHLFPVNYSIASNEDIIRYIKYDIIFQLLKKNRQINEASKSYLKSLPKFFQKNIDKVAAAFIYMIPKIGQDVVASYDRWYGLAQDFLKFHDENNLSDGDRLVDYLQTFETMDGGLFENDIITQIIARMIGENEGRQSVLIVDDLDRLDPEHTFRIMNVFAAHFDNPNISLNNQNVHQKNKFGFDKILLVCDFCNIENLFHYKYGKEVDFAGYSDKFYSSDVFHFNNTSAVSLIINKCLRNALKVNTTDTAEFQHFAQLLLSDDFLSATAEFLVRNSLINLRNVLKIESVKITLDVDLIFSKSNSISAGQLPIVLKLKILRDIVGDARRLFSILKNCKSLKMPFENYGFLFGQFMFITKLIDKDFSFANQRMFFYKGNSVVLSPRMTYNQLTSVQVLKCTKINDKEYRSGDVLEITADDFWDSMLDACSTLVQIGFLR